MVRRGHIDLIELKRNPIIPYLLLVIITLVAAGLRFYKLGEWSFWIEEHHSVRDVLAFSASPKSILSHARPLFFLLVIPVFNFLGVSEWTARLVPALIGIVTVPLLYWIVKKIFNVPVALLSAILLAVSPWHLYWSQNARFYVLFLLLYNLSFFAFYWGLEKDRLRYILLSIVFLALAGAAHNLALLLIPVYFVYFFLLKMLPFEKPPGLRMRYLALFIVLPLVGYGLYEVFRLLTGNILLTAVIYRRFFNEATASFIGYASPYVMLTAVVYYITVPLAMLALPGSLYLLLQKKREGLFLSVGAFFPFLLLMLLTLVASTSNRYVFMTLPCWIILGAIGVKEFYSRIDRYRQILTWVVIIFFLLLLDPVVEDLIFYVQRGRYVGFLASVIGLIPILGALLLFWRGRQANKPVAGVFLWSLVVLVLFVHPIVADSLYYAYQHGHRDNWKAVSVAIEREKTEGDTFVASTVLAAYYLQHEVESIKKVDFDTVLQNGTRVWLVEDFGMGQSIGNRLDSWMEANCRLVDVQDQYTGGRLWKMRAHLCTPTVLSSAQPAN